MLCEICCRAFPQSNALVEECQQSKSKKSRLDLADAKEEKKVSLCCRGETLGGFGFILIRGFFTPFRLVE